MSSLKKWFWYSCSGLGLGAIIILVLSSGFLGFRLFQLEWKPQGKTDLTMREVTLPFANQTDLTKETGSLPFMAGVVIDVNGDLQDEVFLGGGRDQADALMAYDASRDLFVEIGSPSAFDKFESDATMGGTSIDVNEDGWTDLIVARESGVWLHLNDQGVLQVALPLLVPFEATSTPLSIAAGDINQDGYVDFYVSGYLKNSLVDGQTNFDEDYGGRSKLLLGGPDLTWTDATAEYGLDSQHNRFTAVFVDLDNDSDQDLVIAQDTGMVEIWENTGSPPLKPTSNPSQKSYPMGIAAGDLTGNGLIDLYFSNVGHTLPSKLLRGDLPKEVAFNPLYMLFENAGDMTFSDTAKDHSVARLGFGWGTVAADLNMDGWDDLIVAQNYAKFGQPAIIHRYSGKILQNNAGNDFKPIEKRIGAGNRLFAISPLIGDFNGDNLPDLIWANLNGPSKAFFNTMTDTKSLTFVFDDTARMIGTKVEVHTDMRTITRRSISSQGLSSDQTAKLMIGVGQDETIRGYTVTYPDGAIFTLSSSGMDGIVDLRINHDE